MTEEQEEMWDRLSHVPQEPYLQELARFMSKRYIFKRYLGMNDEEIDAYMESLKEYIERG